MVAMNIGYIILFLPFVTGIVLDIVNIYLYLCFIIILIKRQQFHTRSHIPSAMPFVSLPLYMIFIIFLVILYVATNKSLIPLGVELKIGIITLIVHIALHAAFLSITHKLIQKTGWRHE